MNKKMTLNPNTKQYLMRMYSLYEEGKLTGREEQQLFQDLLDTGLAWQMGDEVASFTTRLINAGLIESPLKETGNKGWN